MTNVSRMLVPRHECVEDGDPIGEGIRVVASSGECMKDGGFERRIYQAGGLEWRMC